MVQGVSETTASQTEINERDNQQTFPSQQFVRRKAHMKLDPLQDTWP